MNNLFYFNLGFRSDRVFEAFIVAERQTVDKSIITEALSIIKDFLTIENQESLVANLIGKSGPSYSVIPPILWQVYPSKNVSEVIAELKFIFEKLGVMMDKQNKLEPNDFKRIREFFSKLADVSLANIIEPVNRSSVFVNA